MTAAEIARGLSDADLAPHAHDAAIEWCGEKDRETFGGDVDYFLNNWRAFPGLRARVERRALIEREAHG